MDLIEHATDFAEQPEIGSSNSKAVAEAPDDVAPEIPEPEALTPGFTNDKAIGGSDSTPDTTVKKTAARKK